MQLVQQGVGRRRGALGREEKNKLAVGKLAGLDNQIDTATGTLRLKATFATKTVVFSKSIRQRQAHVSTLRQAVVIPGAAVQ